MNNVKRKITGIILSMMMVFTLIPAMSFAADGDTADPSSQKYNPNWVGSLSYNLEFKSDPAPSSVKCDGQELIYGQDYKVSTSSPGTIFMQKNWMKTLAPGTHHLVFSMDTGKDLKADLIVPDTWTVNLKTDPEDSGYFSSGSTMIWSDKYYVEKGTAIPLSAEGYYGYSLRELKVDGKKLDVSDGESFTLNPSADCTIEAVFGSSTSIGLEISSIDFGKAEPGYEQPAPKTVKIKNTGRDDVRLKAPSFTAFTAGDLPQEILMPGDTAEMTVQPKAGLAEGVYEETVKIYAEKEDPDIMAMSLRNKPDEEPLHDAEASLTVRFEVGETEKPLPPAEDPADPPAGAGKAADTGDSSNMALWIALMAASLTGAVIAIRKKRA